ncbi:MAG: IS630 family transposase, partial [Oscillospiraceae bacterium]|nr:IS630 family transposase [Oscillospiraceae bacterium]
MWNHTKKKTTRYKEQKPEKVEDYLKETEEILPEKIAYVDESGIDQYLYREYAYALRGETVTERISGKKFQRT